MIRLILALMLVLGAATACGQVTPDERPGGYGSGGGGRGA